MAERRVRLAAPLAAMLVTVPAATGLLRQAGAAERPVVVVQADRHPHSGRIVVNLPDAVTVKATRKGDEETLGFTPAVRIDLPAAVQVPGVVAIKAANSALIVRMTTRAELHRLRLGSRLVLDVVPGPAASADPPVLPHSDPPAVAAPIGSVLPGLPSPLVAVVDQPVHPTRPPAEPASPPVAAAPVVAPAPAPVPVPPPGRLATDRPDGGTEEGPLSIAAQLVPATDAAPGGLLLPFDHSVGAAAFRRGDRLVLVFDRAKPIDLASAAGDPVLARAGLTLLASATVLSMPLAPGQQAFLSRRPDGWLLSANGRPPVPRAIETRPAPGGLVLPVMGAGRVVVVPDPAGGGQLLVGTTRDPDQAVAVVHRGAGYGLDRTLLGVAVERLTDQIELRPIADGFLLAIPGQPGGSGPDRTGAAAQFSRTLDLATVGVAELDRRYKDAIAAAAAAPAAARRSPRLDAAQAALSLGFGREARDLATVAEADSPEGRDPGRAAFLRAAAAVLETDPDAEALLSDPRIADTDELVLWRALDRAGREPGNGEAAHAIAARLPLLQDYPAPLRDRLAGEAALAIASGGTPAEGALVTGLPDGPKARLARALLAAATPATTAQAMEVLDRLSTDPDPAVSNRAVQAVVDLRLSRHQLTPGQAADRLDAHLLDARMAGQEPELRLRIAKLRAMQQDWPAALSVLRETLALFPDKAEPVHAAAAVILAQVAGTPPGTTGGDPLKQLGLLENNKDLLAGGRIDPGLAAALAERLVQLDLPERAAETLRTALAQPGTAPDRARLGLDLARIQAAQADGAAARATLDATEAPGLPDTLAASRALLRGGIAGKDKAAQAAVPASDAADTPPAAVSGSDIADLSRQVTALPADGTLDDAGQDLVLRLAGASAGDQAVLDRIAQTWTKRFTDPARRDLLRLLTSPRIAQVGDLPRSAADLAATRSALNGLDSALKRSTP